MKIKLISVDEDFVIWVGWFINCLSLYKFEILSKWWVFVLGVGEVKL